MRVMILRGVPGAGKSTYISENKAEADPVVSADLFFMKGGTYKFDPRKLSEAHGWCLRGFVLAVNGKMFRGMEVRPETIWVDNTNITVGEVAPYVALAQAFGYHVEIITLREDPMVAGARNIHGVPMDVVVKRAEVLKEEGDRFPPWWNHRIIG